MTGDRLVEVAPVNIRGRFGTLGNVRRWRQSNKTDSWRTPPDLFAALDDEFHFTVDVAATKDAALCDRFYTADDDGLSRSWACERCWMNPPYSALDVWTLKAATEARAGALVVGLLPVRTDLAWFHENVLDAEAEIRFIRGRVRFLEVRAKLNAPFPSMVVVWGSA